MALGALVSGPDVDPIFVGETIDALRAALAQPDTEMQTYKDALTWISSVNAMDYEYQREAINALIAHGIRGKHE
jgi:hypothetical protein